MMTRQRIPEPSTRSVVASSILSWDLFVSGFLGLVFGLIFNAVDYKGNWPLLVTSSVISITLAGVAWTQRNQLRASLKGTDYGSLVRVTDKNEREASIPFTIVIFVGLVSAVWSGTTAFYIETIGSRTVQAVLLGIAVWLVGWTLLGIVSLVLITGQHDRMSARLERTKERLESEQHLLRSQQRKEGGNTDNLDSVED